MIFHAKLVLLLASLCMALAGCAGQKPAKKITSEQRPSQTITAKIDCKSGVTKFGLHYEGEQSDRLSGYRYRIHMEDGTVIEGITNDKGEASVASCDKSDMAEIEVLGKVE